MKNVKIVGIEFYYPQYSRNTSEIIQEFKDRGEDISSFVQNVLGKETLHLVKDNQENSLTMGINAAKKVLSSTGLKGSDIDMIAFSAISPEYYSPLSALMIHNAIGAKSSTICYDINVSCIGMTFCLNQISKQMIADSTLNRVLLVGSDYISLHIEKTNQTMYPNLGDAACALILEKTTDDCGIIATKYYVDSSQTVNMCCPKCGSSNIRNASKDDLYGKCDLSPFDLEKSVEDIHNILEENNLCVKDISMFCFSQFMLYNINYIREHLDIPPEKSLYIGDKIGYTGTSSPFIALSEAIKQGSVKRGDYLVIWTIGAGNQYITTLMKY